MCVEYTSRSRTRPVHGQVADSWVDRAASAPSHPHHPPCSSTWPRPAGRRPAVDGSTEWCWQSIADVVGQRWQQSRGTSTVQRHDVDYDQLWELRYDPHSLDVLHDVGSSSDHASKSPLLYLRLHTHAVRRSVITRSRCSVNSINYGKMSTVILNLCEKLIYQFIRVLKLKTSRRKDGKKRCIATWSHPSRQSLLALITKPIRNQPTNFFSKIRQSAAELLQFDEFSRHIFRGRRAN